MALQKTVLNELIRKIILVLIALPLVASSNIDCGGKAFHCVNATHFMICVDLGGGISSTIDNFIIPCPPSTVCQGTNHFECEFPRSTTELPIIETSVPSELRLSEITTVTETSIITSTNVIISTVQSTDTNINTVSTTTLQEDFVATNKPVTESVLVENTYYTTTAANTIDTSMLTINDIGYPITETSTPLYQDTVATLIIDDVTVTTVSNILELNYSSTVTINETVSDQSATGTFIVNDSFGGSATEKYTNINNEFALTTNDSSRVENKLLMANNTIGNDDLYQITKKEVIDTTVGTTTTIANTDITSPDIFFSKAFAEAFTESNLNDVTSHSTPQFLTDVTDIENISIFEVFVTSEITDASPRRSVTEQFKTIPNVSSTERASDVRNIYTNITAFNNADTTELTFVNNSTAKNIGGNTIENITTIAGTTYDTTNTNAITQEHNTTESIPQATMTYKNEENVFTTKPTAESSTHSIVTADTVNTLNQETSGFTLEGLTTTSEIITELNISEDGTASILVTEPETTRKFTISETDNETQTTLSYIELSTISVTGGDILSLTTQTLNNVDTVSSKNRFSSNNLVIVGTSNVNDLTDSGVNITNTLFSNFNFGKNTSKETSNKSGLIAEGDNRPTQSTEKNVNEYAYNRFTEGIPFNEIASTISLPPSSEITETVKESIVVQNATTFVDIKTESTITDTTENVFKNTTHLNVLHSTNDISNPILVTESYKMSDTVSTTDIAKRPEIDTNVIYKDHTLITSVADIPITINKKILTTEYNKETTTVTAVGKQEGLDGTTLDSTNINDLNSSYIEKRITKDMNQFEQGITDNILSPKTGLNDNLIHNHVTVSTLDSLIKNNIATEITLSSSNQYQVDTVTEEIPHILTTTDIINKKEYEIATTLQQVLTSNLNIKSVQTGTKEASPTEILPLSSTLQTDSVTATQESMINSEFPQSTVSESIPIKPVLESYLDNAKLKIENERSVDITAPNYTSDLPYVNDATNALNNNYEELRTIKVTIPNEVLTEISDLNNSTLHQVLSLNNTEFKKSIVDTTQSYHKNKFGNTLQEPITNYELAGGITSKTDINSDNDNRNISDSLQTLSILAERTAERENIGKLYENNNLTDTRKPMASDVTFSNRIKDSFTSLPSSADFAGEFTIIENIKKDDNIIQESTTENKTTEETNKTIGSINETMKYDVHFNSQLQSNNSINIHNEENISDKISNVKELSIVTNEHVNNTSINSTNKSSSSSFDSSTSHVANENNQNIYNIKKYKLTDQIHDELLKPINYSQNKIAQHVSVIENKEDSLKTQTTREIIIETQTSSAMKQSVAATQKLGKNVEPNTNDDIFKEMVFSTDNVTSAINDGSLNLLTPLDENLDENGEISTTNKSNKVLGSSHTLKPTLKLFNDSLNQSSTPDIYLHKASLKNTDTSFNKVRVASTLNNVSSNHAMVLAEILGHHTKASDTSKTNNTNFVNFQVTSMPINGSLKQTLVLDQKQSQKATARGTSTLNISSATNTINKTGVAFIQEESTASVIPNNSTIKHQLTSAEKLVLITVSNLGGSDSKPKEKNNVMENTHLSLDSSLSAFPKDSMSNKLENVSEETKVLFNNSENTPVYTTHEVSTATLTESTVKYTTQNSNTDSTDSFDNGQKLIDPFCFTRNRGRYADREDCTKFYVCIGKSEPIVGKCPENTVFSEIKKQCTKNKSHCFRGNEFQCLSEGRFSDVLKNNAYYICIKRQNSFIRFKFQCQNGYYLNKITERCTKQLEITNQSSTSVDNSNSEKSVSEGVSSTETKKSNNHRDSKKESKSGKEFECKKEGKFAVRDNCRKFYVCTKTKKSEFRMRRKSCDSDEVFHKDKKKCVDADSYEC